MDTPSTPPRFFEKKAFCFCLWLCLCLVLAPYKHSLAPIRKPQSTNGEKSTSPSILAIRFISSGLLGTRPSYRLAISMQATASSFLASSNMTQSSLVSSS